MGPFLIAQVNDIGQSLDGLVNLEFYDKKFTSKLPQFEQNHGFTKNT